MTKQEMSSDAANQDARIKELTDENELLFEQLHVVQEELEKYYHKLKECEQSKGTAVASSSLPLDSFEPRLPEALAENQKLRALVAQQKIALRVETQNSLPSRLGDMLIKGVSSTRAFLALPGNLRKMWKALERTTPPAELGGKSFQKILDVYGAGGADAVEKLLDSVFIAPNMRANAYTALARHLMIIDGQKAAAFAHLAYEADPRPYRFKWLAFRMHDADDVVTAEAMLDMLPADIPMSESEQRQVLRIRHESTQLRKKNAEKDADVQKQKNSENQNIVQLTRQVEEWRCEAERLRQQQKELQNIADDRHADLKATQAHLAEQKELTERRDAEVVVLSTAQADLQARADGYKAEIDALQASLAEQKAFAESRDVEIAALISAQSELQTLADGYKAEIDALQASLAEQKGLIERRDVEVTALSSAQSELQAELIESRKSASLLKVTLEDIAYKNTVSVFAKNNKKNKDDNVDVFIKDLDFFFNGKNITYVDIGANVGAVYSKIIDTAKNFRVHEAHLYEPNPDTFLRLKECIAGKNNIVHAYNVAIGVEKKLTFLPAKSMSKSVMSSVANNALPDDVFQVDCVKLDDQKIVITDGHINLLKIDVEGSELDVLTSSYEILVNQHVDMLYIEVGFNRLSTQQTYFAKVDEYLQPLGYRILRIYEQVDEWMSGSPVLRRANIAYMSDNFSKGHPLKLMQELQDLKVQIEKLTTNNKSK